SVMRGSGEGIRLDGAGASQRIAELAGMLGVEIDADAEAGSLALGQQQQVEIIKALWRGSQVLILDEPTSMLSPAGIAELAKALTGLEGHGLAIVLITHKLHRATSMGHPGARVLGRGRVVGALAPADLGGRREEDLQAAIVGMMFGEGGGPTAEVVELQAHVEGHRPRRELPSEPILELERVSVARRGGEMGL